ncbi:hypothetical protein AVEN_89742-1 [Araneus ventricosus]|uniref:Uncharacterized protein n=1 Tax=Araneus ventricosus TaxID=182803 RepID=A0A4Y2J977_ARAVE|nr:hypothetical protein AVEN_89742-1 [Araneus ventricosus]
MQKKKKKHVVLPSLGKNHTHGQRRALRLAGGALFSCSSKKLKVLIAASVCKIKILASLFQEKEQVLFLSLQGSQSQTSWQLDHWTKQLVISVKFSSLGSGTSRQFPNLPYQIDNSALVPAGVEQKLRVVGAGSGVVLEI